MKGVALMPDGIPIASLIALAYEDLYARQLALMAVLERRGVLDPRDFESEVESYHHGHADGLVGRAQVQWKALVRTRFPEAFE